VLTASRPMPSASTRTSCSPSHGKWNSNEGSKMMRNYLPKCHCGSGEPAYAELDGYGIFLCYACDKCRKRKLAGFRPDIKTRYDTDEQIEDDY
jgi:hypothetical protein